MYIFEHSVTDSTCLKYYESNMIDMGGSLYKTPTPICCDVNKIENNGVGISNTPISIVYDVNVNEDNIVGILNNPTTTVSISRDVSITDVDVEVMTSPSNISDETEPSYLSSKNVEIDDHIVTLTGIKAKNSIRIIIGHISVNSIVNKFESLVSIFKDKIDIMLISETKIDETFPNGQFIVDGYSTPIRLDRNCLRGGLIFYFREDIPCKEIKSQTTTKYRRYFSRDYHKKNQMANFRRL